MKPTLSDCDLNKIVESHKKYLEGLEDGKRAVFTNLNLVKFKFKSLDLRSAIFEGCDLESSEFTDCDLSRAFFIRSVLNHNMFIRSNLKLTEFIYTVHNHAGFLNCNLERGDFFTCVLNSSSFTNTDLKGCSFNNPTCSLDRVDFSTATNVPVAVGIRYTICPEVGAFNAYKKLNDNKIALLLIPEDAKRSSATDRKCRASKAIVQKIWQYDWEKECLGEEVTVGYSIHDPKFQYKVGETVEPDSFEENRWHECAPGIHFFITLQEAINYYR